MTAETEGTGSGSAAPAGNSWGRILLRVIITVVAFAALVAFSAVLAELTLTPSPASAEIAGSNLQPGRSLRQYAEDYTFLAACKQIGGNLLMGVPFGLILPVLVPRRARMVRVVALTAVVMVLVELAQGSIVEGRAFDVDDVIMNTSGALIGYLLLGRRIGRRFHALAEPPVRKDAPARSKPARSKPVMTKPATTKRKPADKKPTAKKPAVKKQTAKSGAAKSGAAKKPSLRKSGSAGGPSWTERLARRR
ncbi:VanZ family protein [Streptomyces sp. NPDC058405]|uniref:VanZ family protein n=1 Tax=Streptomyces sp. NPDC058405 TaxID=3346482 RepID=UPI00365B863F